jgi:hypothetical protein
LLQEGLSKRFIGSVFPLEIAGYHDSTGPSPDWRILIAFDKTMFGISHAYKD